MNIKEKAIKSFSKMKTGIERFPLTAFFSIVTSGLLFYIIEISEFEGWDIVPARIWKLTVLLILGIPIMATLELIREKYFSDKSVAVMRTAALIITSILLSFIKIIYLSHEKIEDFLGLFFIGVISCLLFFLVPVINRKNDGEKYIQTVVMDIAVTVTFSVILYLGIVAIIGAIDILLVNIKNSIYLQFFVFTVFIFGIIFFLSRLKKVNENLEEYEINTVFKTLLKFIIIPLILIYTGVLYLYLGKILIYLKIPNGVISHLVLWYTVFSLFVIVIVTPMAEKDNIVRLFKKNFPVVSIPLIILSLVAIFIRIKQYAVTESRYYIVIIAFWLLFCMILYIFRANRTNLTFIIVSLIFVIFVAIYSPVNAENTALLSQNKRLEKLLVQNGLVKDGKLVKNPALSDSIKAEIQNVVDYLLYKSMSPYSIKRNERIGNLRPFGKTYENPEKFKNAIGMDESWKSYYLENLKETKIIYKINEDTQYDNYISKAYGYEYLIQYGRDYGKYQKFSEKYTVIKNNDEISVLNKKDEKEILKIDINKILTEIMLKKEFNLENSNETEKLIPENAMEYIGENENIKYKLAFKYIYTQKNDDGKYSTKEYYMDFLFSEK